MSEVGWREWPVPRQPWEVRRAWAFILRAERDREGGAQARWCRYGSGLDDTRGGKLGSLSLEKWNFAILAWVPRYFF